MVLGLWTEDYAGHAKDLSQTVLKLPQSHLNILHQILHMLDAHRQAHDSIGDAHLMPFLGRHGGVRCARRVADGRFQRRRGSLRERSNEVSSGSPAL